MALKNSFATSLMLNYDLTVADPDLQIRKGGGWGGGGSVTRQRDKGIPGLNKKFFHPLGPQFDLWGEPRASPLDPSLNSKEWAPIGSFRSNQLLALCMTVTTWSTFGMILTVDYKIEN